MTILRQSPSGKRVAATTVPFDSLGSFSAERGVIISSRENLGLYQWLDSQNLAPNSAQVVNAPGGQWQRLYDVPIQEWVNQATWAIDPVSGNDLAAGGSTAPLKTWVELRARINAGVYPSAQQKNVEIRGNLAESLLLAFTIGSNSAAAGGRLNITGAASARTVLYSGTITALVTSFVAGVTCLEMTDAAVGDWNTAGPGGTTLIGHRIRFISGAASGACAFVGKRVAATTARIAPVSASTQSTINSATATILAPAPGDAFVVEQLPTVSDVNLQFSRSENGTSLTAFAGTIFDLQLGTATTARLVFDSQSRRQAMLLCQCRTVASSIEGSVNAKCLGFGSSATWAGISLQASFMLGVLAVSSAAPDVPANVGGGTLVQGGALAANTTCTISTTQGVCIFDSNTAGLNILAAGTSVNAANAPIWGSGNTTNGCVIQAGAILCQQAVTPSVTGSTPGVNDVRVGGTDQSWAAAIAAGGSAAKLCGVVTSP